MGVNKYIENIKNCSELDFTDNQLTNFREHISGLYKILKNVFDSPRKMARCYNSIVSYELSREKRFQSPDEYYRFIDDNVIICIRYRSRLKVYCVGVIGWRPRSVSASYIDDSDFSCGFNFYGGFTRKDFKSCVYLWSDLIKEYLNSKKMELF